MDRPHVALRPDVAGRSLMLRLLHVYRTLGAVLIAAQRLHGAAAFVAPSIAIDAAAREHDHVGLLLDVVAGSEFVDDRIRMIE
jgi:hypothetical protein